MKRQRITSLAMLLILSLLACFMPHNADSSRYKSGARWKYIVIHHSATRKGNAEIMDRYHRNKRHMSNGLAYHFVIGNGTSGCRDGEIQESRRWAGQLAGGHVKQPWLNDSGIGICLVGNFNRQTVTKKQMESLVNLVSRLCAAYDIPLSCVRGHGNFGGEHTMCPGRNFPMTKIKKILASRATTPVMQAKPNPFRNDIPRLSSSGRVFRKIS